MPGRIELSQRLPGVQARAGTGTDRQRQAGAQNRREQGCQQVPCDDSDADVSELLDRQARCADDQREKDDRYHNHLEHLHEHLAKGQDMGDDPLRKGRTLRSGVARRAGQAPEQDSDQRAQSESDENAKDKRGSEVPLHDLSHRGIQPLELTIYCLLSSTGPRAAWRRLPTLVFKS